MRRMRPFGPSAAASRFESGNSRYGFCEISTNSSSSRARFADARFGRIFPFEAPQNAEQIEAPRLGLKLRAEHQRTPLRPRRGGQRIISPRSTVRTIGLGEVVDRDIFGEEAVEHGAEQKSARALEGPSFQDDRDLKPARRGCARRLTQAPHDRARRDAAHAANLGVGRGVGEIGEQNQRLAKRRGAVVGRRSTSPKWLRLSMLMRRQATSPVEAS